MSGTGRFTAGPLALRVTELGLGCLSTKALWHAGPQLDHRVEGTGGTAQLPAENPGVTPHGDDPGVRPRTRKAASLTHRSARCVHTPDLSRRRSATPSTDNEQLATEHDGHRMT